MTAPYTSGTITLTNGSNIITGTGTGWATSLVVGGTVYPDANGNSLPIVSVDSDTKITAATKWRGATGTYSYAIMRDTAYGQQTVANAQALATYIQRLGSGLMAGLASLAPAANKVISFGDQSQAELVDLKTIGKNLLAAGDRAAAYGALGEILNAQLPTRLQAIPTIVSAANALDNISESGWVRVALANVVAVNGPTNGGSGVCFTILFDGNAGMQIYTQVTNASGANRQWIRNKAGGTWTAWTPSVVGDITNASSLASGTFRGWGFGPGTASATLDANALTGSGMFLSAAGSTNTPGNGWTYIIQGQRDTDRKTQIAFDAFSSNPRVYIRGQLAEGWSAWRTIPFGQLSPTDNMANSAMLVGAFGLGGAGILLANTDDLNSLPNVTAFYRMSSSSPPANMPTPVQSCVLVNTFYSAGASSQMLLSVNSSLVWYRQQAGNVWGAWTRMDGDVSGPAVAIDNAPVGFSGTSGKSIKQITGPVAALHAVTGAANKLPYFTGAATMATTDFTAFARTLLDDPDAAAMWFTLGGTQSLVASGWQRLPSGLIIQWGKVGVAGGNAAITFPMAFPNACYVVVGSNATEGQDGVTAYVGWADVWSVTGFAARGRFINSGGMGQAAINLAYIAIGR
ncbi:pyocin knob domain-containing protein [Agrobacterium tumefaciens]|uniref:pyocin knob domain-containing protein n=1 Tax=Agrobacterium tumefaciens TaxID=358 RepID=UPI00385163F3